MHQISSEVQNMLKKPTCVLQGMSEVRIGSILAVLIKYGISVHLSRVINNEILFKSREPTMHTGKTNVLLYSQSCS
jgi:hypothetical protein